jgi:hypothetical protein
VEKTEFNVPMPKVEGVMDFEVVTEGQVPPSDLTYDEWLQCDYDAWEETNRPTDYASRMATLANNGNDYDCTDLFTAPGSYMEDTMWSPRRAHAAVVDGDNVIYLMGGRAREHKRLANERAVGGITTRFCILVSSSSSSLLCLFLQSNVKMALECYFFHLSIVLT